MQTLNVLSAPASAALAPADTNPGLILSAASSAKPAAIIVPANYGKLIGKEFHVTASGYVVTVGNYNITVGLYANVGAALPATPTAVASWTLIGASTARAVNNTNAPFLYKAKLIVAGAAGKMHGTFSAVVNNLYDTDAAVSNVLSAISFTSATGGIAFALGITFSNAAAAQSAVLQQFALEL